MIEDYPVLMSAPAVPTMPAPRRGQYDRRQPREVRLQEQRTRLLVATAQAVAQESEPTIATVVKIAGVSRNTFYEYFDDLGHARAAAAQRAEQHLLELLRAAEGATRTPVERWRALSRAWWQWVDAMPFEAALCLDRGRRALSVAGRALEAAFARSRSTLIASGIRAEAEDGLRPMALAAAGEALACAALAAPGGEREGARRVRERERHERHLADLAARLLR